MRPGFGFNKLQRYLLLVLVLLAFFCLVLVIPLTKIPAMPVLTKKGHIKPVVPGNVLGKGEQYPMEPPGICHVVPRLLKRVEPIYPSLARGRVEGVVLMVVMTNIYGKVVRTRIISGHPLLRKSALDAVKQWEYEPLIIKGLPKPSLFTVSINYKINKH